MASPSYDLGVQGVVTFARFGRVLSQRKIARDPLSGIANGTNKAFFTNYFPMLTSGSLVVYDSTSGSALGGSADYDTGEVTLTTAPTVQPEATYTFTPYTATQVLQFLISGLDEMESRWSRGLKLVTASGGVADENSANLYVADKDGNEPTSASDGTITFSGRRTQIAFLMACTEFRYYLSQLGEAGIGDFMFRETLRGMSVDKSRRPSNIELALKATDERAKRAAQIAQDEWFADGSHLGGYTASPVTLEYVYVYEWAETSKEQDYRAQLGFHQAFRPLTYP